MAKLHSSSNSSSHDVDHHVVAFPTRPATTRTGITRPAARVPAETPVPATDRPAADPRQVRVSRHITDGAVVLTVSGELSEAGQELDLAIQHALAEAPRGVVCDLSKMLEGADQAAVDLLAMAGRHTRDWSGTPVAVACPDPKVRSALAAHSLGAHLIVTESVASAVSAVLATPALSVQSLRLAPHPTAARAAREFVTRTLLGWGLDPLILSADLVVSELVTSATMQATSGIEVSISWNLRGLRLTVRDDSPDLPRQRYTQFDMYGSRLTGVAGLSRAFGTLPTADGGKVVWALLNAARPRPSTSRRRPVPAGALREPPTSSKGPGLAGCHLFAVPSPIQPDARL